MGNQRCHGDRFDRSLPGRCGIPVIVCESPSAPSAADSLRRDVHTDRHPASATGPPTRWSTPIPTPLGPSFPLPRRPEQARSRMARDLVQGLVPRASPMLTASCRFGFCYARRMVLLYAGPLHRGVDFTAPSARPQSDADRPSKPSLSTGPLSTRAASDRSQIGPDAHPAQTTAPTSQSDSLVTSTAPLAPIRSGRQDERTQ